MTTLSYILLIAVVLLLVHSTHISAYDKGFDEGYMEGAKAGFNDGVNKTLQLIRVPLLKKHGLDITEYFQELMNDEELVKATFGIQKIDDDDE